MDIRVVSFNGLNINDGTSYTAKVLKTSPMQKVSVFSTERTAFAPAYGGKGIKGTKFELEVVMKGTAASQIETLGRYIDPEDQSLRTFVVSDANNSSKQWYLNATPIEPFTWSGTNMRVEMWTPDPVWKSVSQFSGTISVNGTTTASGTITTNGNKETYPTIEITPSSYPTGGYGYRSYVTFYNRSTKDLTNYPLNISGTSGVWDTATLVSGGKMQADGDDIRVMVNGVETNYWLNGMNSATTSVWIAITAKPLIQFTLGTAISNTGTPNIVIANTNLNKTALAKLTTSKGILRIDSEEFSFNGLNATTRTFTTQARSIRNTSAASHSVGATVTFIEHDIVILYGNPSATAPDIDDTNKPIIELPQSTNTSHVYSYFSDENYLRAGSWKPVLKSTVGKLSFIYTGDQGTTGVYPSESMGIEAVAYQFGTTWKAESINANWTLYTPCQGTVVTMSGYKYLSSLSSAWLKDSGLYSSVDGVSFSREWIQAKPSTAAVWQSWTQSNEAIATGRYYVQLQFSGAISAIANTIAAMQVDSATVGFNQTITPYVEQRTEEQNYWLDLTLTNSTLNEGITIKYPAALNETFYIDTDARTVTYKGVSALGSVLRDSVRAEWLRLQSGANVINYSTTSGGTVNIVFKWYDRQNI